MRTGGKIDENFLLAKISGCTVSSLSFFASLCVMTDIIIGYRFPVSVSSHQPWAATGGATADEHEDP